MEELFLFPNKCKVLQILRIVIFKTTHVQNGEDQFIPNHQIFLFHIANLLIFRHYHFYLHNHIYGGSIYFDQSNGSIQNCYFSNSSFKVIYDGYGICIYLKSSSTSINNCSFEFNSATTESANIYGTLYISYSNATLYQCNFISNNISALKTYSSCFGCAIYFTESSTEIIESNFIHSLHI